VIVGELLVLFGIEGFLVESIRITPGYCEAQIGALLTVFAGVVVLVVARGGDYIPEKD
jgi:hypothetical protein